MSAQPPSSQPSAVLQECLEDARREARLLIEKLVDFTRHNLRHRESAGRNFTDRNAVTAAIDELGRHQRGLVDGFVTRVNQGLMASPQAATEKAQNQSLMQLKFDQLELMDEDQVQSRVELARALQMTLHAVDPTLPELNTLSCALQGLPVVIPDRNPFRPEMYLRALQASLESVPVSAAVRMVWTQQMCSLLGTELNDFYRFLNHKLKQRGIKPALYTVAQQEASSRPVYVPEVLPVAAPPSMGVVGSARGSAPVSGAGLGQGGSVVPTGSAAGRSVASGSPAASGRRVGAGAPPLYLDALPQSLPGPLVARDADDASALTVGQLRRLLASDGNARGARAASPDASRLETFAQQFERRFEAEAEPDEVNHTDFDSTLPAAFDALSSEREMSQVLQRLAQRQGALAPAGRPISVRELREQLRRQGQEVGPLVALEVVALMIDNITRDARLPQVVRQTVRELENPLAQLVVADQRFFSDKAHPARRLLDELTQRSLAFENESAPGFEAFMAPVRQVAEMLGGAAIDGPGPFEVAFKELERTWSEHQEAERRKRDLAVKALLHAEQRNLLATRLRHELKALPGLAQVPAEVSEFLLGPWVQVMAQARLGDRASEGDPGHYLALVDELLWSAQPVLTRRNPGRLTRLIPSLLGRLREGLKTIDYPPVQTSAFLEKLIVLHQAGYRTGVAAPAQAPSELPSAASRPPAELPTASPTEIELDDNPAWLAPQEARDSGFLTLPSEQPAEDEALPLLPPLANEALPTLELGNWVEMNTGRGWQRSQLTWASPHGTLFLFTRPDGSTQSMTRRMRERMMREGLMRVLSTQPVVAGALDEVARTALRNTVSTPEADAGGGPGPVTG